MGFMIADKVLRAIALRAIEIGDMKILEELETIGYAERD
jgi:hypothetical protein